MSSTRLELLASAAQTATAQGGAIPVANLTELAVVADVTAASGSLTLYLQASPDGGTTWADLPYELALETAASSHTAGTSSTNDRNIVTEAAAVVVAKAKYKTFGDLVRAAWHISGSGATFTFSVNAVGKT